MKKVYRFNLIPGVEFVEEDGFCFAMADDPVWSKPHITKVVIDGFVEYEKKLKDTERNCSVLNGQIEYIKKCAENEIDHRNKLLEENDKSIEYIHGKLHEEIMKNEAYKETIKTLKEENNNLIDLIAKRPISKSPVPLSSASDCSDLYICSPDHIAYGNIAGEFGIGLYVGDTLVLLKGDKASEVVRERSSMIDKINTLEAALKKKDEMIEELGGIVKFANNTCDGYGALTDSLMNTINERNSEIKVLSDQVTRLMDQIKEVIGDDTEFEQRVETETKPETNFDKMMSDMRCKSCINGPESCCDICGNIDCEYRIEECREGIIKEGKSETNSGKTLRNLVISALDAWLNEDTKED